LTVTDKGYTLFWGLSNEVNSGWGCPITIYYSPATSTLAVYNKVTVSFTVDAFPTSAANHRLILNVGGASPNVPIATFATNLPITAN